MRTEPLPCLYMLLPGGLQSLTSTRSGTSCLLYHQLISFCPSPPLFCTYIRVAGASLCTAKVANPQDLLSCSDLSLLLDTKYRKQRFTAKKRSLPAYSGMPVKAFCCLGVFKYSRCLSALYSIWFCADVLVFRVCDLLP